MPIDQAAAAAGANFLGQAINFYQQGKANAQQIGWNTIMYNRQRKDAIADWNMQNAYNTPAAQMQRLRDAGLNPNLVYGNGVQASNASPVRNTDAKGYTPNPPQVNLGSVVSSYQDFKTQQMQQDNLQAQLELLNQQKANQIAKESEIYANIALKSSQRDLTDSNVQLKGLDLQYQPQMKAWALAALKASVEKTLQDTQLSKANTAYRLDENERAQLRNGMTLKEAAERILRMRAQTINDNARTDYQKQLAQWQIKEIEERIKKIQEDAKGSHERARILKSTPDYWGQQGIQAVQSVIGNVGKKGFSMNPKSTKAPERLPLGGYKYGKNSKTWEPDDWEPNY